MELLGGLALFLLGLGLMSDGLKAAAGARLEGLLARITGNNLCAALTGAGVRAVIQSSSVTTVLAVGFVAAGVMSFQQSTGVIMGANVGTTMTAQILAFKVEKAALGFVAAGFAVGALAKGDMARSLGRVTMGLGLVFLGMELMGDGMRPLPEWPPFIDLMAQMNRPLLGVLRGCPLNPGMGLSLVRR
jgi:phosphate:Na+ symporter